MAGPGSTGAIYRVPARHEGVANQMRPVPRLWPGAVPSLLEAGREQVSSEEAPMLDRLPDYRGCLREPDRWAVATVAAVSGSVPRPIGTSMAVRDDGTTIGSVSAGCVESAVVDAAMTNLAAGAVTLENFGYGDDDGLAAGLMCGGDLQVLVQPMVQLAPLLRQMLGADRGRWSVIRSLDTADLGRPVLVELDGVTAEELDRRVGPGAGQLLSQVVAGGAQSLAVQAHDGLICPITQRLLAESLRPRRRLVIYGANDHAAALARAAALLDRQVTVCDARPVFATARRHPGADEVLVEHPADHLRAELRDGRLGPRDAVVVLTHDPRFDLPVLDLALRSSVGYVGAMGSRQTVARRAQELRHGGLLADRLDRLHSPIGLNLGARTPAEVAVAVLAELIAAEHGTTGRGSGVPLRATVGPVHDALVPEPTWAEVS